MEHTVVVLKQMNVRYQLLTGEPALVGELQSDRGLTWVFADDYAAYTLAGALEHMTQMLAKARRAKAG